MRCASCHSYIPEGLPEPITCPQCGKQAAAAPARGSSPETGKAAPATAATKITPAFATEPPPLPETTRDEQIKSDVHATPATQTHAEAYAPYFTIRTRLAFSPARTGRGQVGRGSISFGPNGFSIVCLEGGQWEKVPYHSLSDVRVEGDSLFFSMGDLDRRLTFFHPWLPAFLPGPRNTRARVFAELLSRVRGGLTPFEIASYQRKLS